MTGRVIDINQSQVRPTHQCHATRLGYWPEGRKNWGEPVPAANPAKANWMLMLLLFYFLSVHRSIRLRLCKFFRSTISWAIGREKLRIYFEKEEARAAMITRSNLAEQLREYQIRSKHDWASVSFFSSTSNFTSSRVDVVVFVIWELLILAFLVFSAVSLYFRHLQLAFILVCVTMLLLLCMKITKQVRLARKKKRRMLLPLSMWQRVNLQFWSEPSLSWRLWELLAIAFGSSSVWLIGICNCTSRKLIKEYGWCDHDT